MESTLLITAISLGFALAASPGVVNTECVRRRIASGFSSAFSIQAGSLVGDGFWAIVALTGLTAIAGRTSLTIALAFVGGCFLLNLAFSAARSTLTPRSEAAARRANGNLRTGVIFGLANPAGLAFWAGIGGGLLARSGSSATFAEVSGFLLAFLVGALIWSITLSALASAGRRYASPGLFRLVDALAATLLGYFGIRMLWDGARQLRKVSVLAG